MRFSAFALLTTSLVAFASESPAQCCAPQPTVAYSPVVAAPVVQTTTVRDGWYPGKYLTDFTRGLFGLNQTTYTTNYAPTAAPYAVGYAPSPYTAGYAPAYQTAYRPVYPATYGQVAYAPAPLTQTVSRPVVLSPVVSAPACDACSSCSGGGCSACGVEQAGYYAPGSSPCSSGNCSPAPPSYAPTPAPSYGSGNSYPEPQPALPPEANVPPREQPIDVRRPEVEDRFEDAFDDTYDSDRTEGDPAAANNGYYSAPPLFPPSNRVTQRRAHPAPTRTAVYKRAPTTTPTAYRATERDRPAPRGKVNRLSADAWTAGG